MLSAYLIDYHPTVFPFDDEVCVDFHREIPVFDLQYLEVVEPDRYIHWVALFLV